MLIGDTSKIELEFGSVGFLRRGENRRTRRKTSQSKDENQQQTQPTYDTGTGNRSGRYLLMQVCVYIFTLKAERKPENKI